VVARVVLAAALAGLLQSAAQPVLVIAHRGASGHRPEHTLEAYALAIDMGADYIEPDLVATRDGVLVARHENEIGATTDVERRFPERKATRTIEGRSVTGYFTEDFTLDELRTLRARERLPFRSHAYDGQFLVPTFDEVLTLAAERSRTDGRVIGVYPEIKHPAYFRSIGLALESRLLDALAKHGHRARESAVFIQSFEPQSLRILRAQTRLRLIQLLDQDADVSADRLADIARYADGVGINTRLVLPVDANGRLQTPTSVVEDAHRAGLVVHAWTLRSEPVFLASEYGGDPLKEYAQLASLGVDGIFTDFPDVAVKALRSSTAR